LPAPDAGLRRAGLAHDLVGPDAVGTQKHNVCSPNMLLRGVTVPGDRFKPMAIWSCDLDGNPGAPALDSHARQPNGIPSGTLMLGRDH
jgi:hypothetical protein